MKKIFYLLLACATLVVVMPLSAQVRAYKAATIEGVNSVAYALPQTAIKVSVVAEKEVIRKGPYARFAQKYLGVMAPLADKELYRIAGARLTYTEEADPVEVYVMDNPEKSPLKLYTAAPEGFVATPIDGNDQVLTFGQPQSDLYSFYKGGVAPLSPQYNVLSYVSSDTSFVKVSVDRRELIEKSAEEMAATAATTIFTLRKRRIELVTGEAGENVFGAGLQTAIAELNRLEQEYLALFLGKQYTVQEVRNFTVIPEMGKATAVVCRFSEAAGVVEAVDLSGRPIVLEFAPEGRAQRTALARRGKDPRGTIFYRVADVVKCRLVDGKQVLMQERLPIYQFGQVVEIPVTSLK